VKTAIAVILALVVTLTGCRSGTQASSNPPPAKPAPAATLSTPSGPAGQSNAPAAAAARSSDLAAISSDLEGIDAGTNQANQDLGAGDAARTQDDDN
jgi:hypothetical protein